MKFLIIMKIKIIITFCLFCVLISCTNKNNKMGLDDSSSVADDSIVNDTISIRNITVKDSLKQGNIEWKVFASVDFPVSNNKKLVRSICSWINSSLGGGDNVDIDNPDKIMEVYSKKALQPNDDEMMFSSEDINQISKYYESEKFVTYQCVNYGYYGGAHGAMNKYGVTFRKSDGRIFGWDMFRSDFDYQELFEKALMEQYYQVNTKKELYDRLLITVSDKTPLPKPVTSPYLTEDGVEFVYQEYEISPYCDGIPTFTLPFSDVEKYLTNDAKNLLK